MQNNLCSKFIKSTLLATLSLSALTTTVQAAEESQEITVVRSEITFNNSFFIRSDGSLWACGLSSKDRLGEAYGGTSYTTSPVMIDSSDVIDVSASSSHTAYVKSDGSLWGTGSNQYGQLGLDGHLDNHKDKTIEGPSMIIESDVIDVECNALKTFFIKEDGSLWGMGKNTDFVLSRTKEISYKTIYRTPVLLVESGVANICSTGNVVYYITADGSLWAFGENTHGQITGHNDDDDEIFIPHQIFDAETSSFVINPEFHSLLMAGINHSDKYGSINSDNYAHCAHHQSAHPDRIVSVQTSDDIGSLILDNEGTLWGLGRASYGTFGPGTLERAQQNRHCLEKIATGVIAMDHARQSTFFIKEDNTLWAMGSNNNGQLGDESLTIGENYNTPQYIASDVVSISTNGNVTSFITIDGKLFTFGDNWKGQLGDGTKDRRYSPVEITFE